MTRFAPRTKCIKEAKETHARQNVNESKAKTRDLQAKTINRTTNQHRIKHGGSSLHEAVVPQAARHHCTRRHHRRHRLHAHSPRARC